MIAKSSNHEWIKTTENKKEKKMHVIWNKMEWKEY